MLVAVSGTRSGKQVPCDTHLERTASLRSSAAERNDFGAARGVVRKWHEREILPRLDAYRLAAPSKGLADITA